MDPKMDSGFIPPGDTFEADFDPATPVSLPELLWVMDQILCLEIMWHAGYALSQTVFTSLHIDRLLGPQQPRIPTLYSPTGGGPPENLTEEQSIGHAVLTAYCVAVIKCCDMVVGLVQSQNFYEEEDFVTHLFGRELLPHMSTNTIDGMLDGVIPRLEDFGNVGEDVKEALLLRLQFRSIFLGVLSDRTSEQQWEQMLGLLKTIKTSHTFSTPLPDAFSDKVQRQLATSTPPRPMLSTSWEDACTKWSNMCEHIVAVNRLTQSEVVYSPACLQRAVWAFSYRGEAFPLPRAIMQDILFGEQAIRGEVLPYDLLLADIRDLVLAGDTLVDPQSFQVEVTTDPRHICSRLIEGFMDKAIEEYLNLYRMMCQNRCRIRRTFTQSIPIFDAMVTEAKNVDVELQKITASKKLTDTRTGKAYSLDPLSSWARFYKLRIMAWTIQLGFETEIYLPDELGGTYWFLAQLSQQRSELLDRVLQFTIGRSFHVRHDQNAVADCMLSEKYLESLHAVSEITRLIAEALWKLFTLLTSTGVVAKPERDYASQQLMYEARMKPYLAVVNDPVPSAAEFDDATTHHGSLEQTCNEVDEHIKEAKQLLVGVKKMTPEQAKYLGTEEEWKEVKGLEATCIAVAVTASQVRNAGKKYGEDGELATKLECKAERRWAEWWVVPVIKEKVSSQVALR